MIFSFDLKIARLIGAVLRPWQRRFVKVVGQNDGRVPMTLITGASSGIGAALALELGRAGDHLLLVGQDEGRLQSIVADVRADVSKGFDNKELSNKELGTQKIVPVVVDLTDSAALDKIDAVLNEQGGYVDRLINNAGLGERDDFLASDFDQLAQVIEVNVQALVRLSHHFLPGMVDRGEGALVNMASIGGLAPAPYQSVYYASKAFVISFTEALAHEVRGRGVYVGAVLPGPVKTRFHHKIGGQRALYYWLLWKMRPKSVARSVHRALLARHWAVITPGPFYMVLGVLLRVIPGSLLVPMFGLLYKKW